MAKEYLKDHANAIGEVCIAWGGMERIFESLAAVLLGLKFASKEIHVIAANTDIRGLMGICSAMSAIKAPSKKWKSELDAVINLVDNDLRLKRNRVVHDLWLENGGSVQRFYVRAKIAKPRSFAPKQLSTYEYVTQSATEIMAIAQAIYDACDSLVLLGRQIPGWPDDIAK